ncbi:MAG: flagellin [Thaumarchaeota archaeon]|nr:flagellin [Nitrososphaerota archaeon]
MTQYGKRVQRSKAGLTGLETAIILIAFVITASAFAFGVLNLGFTSTQKSTEVIGRGLKESASAIALDGDVVVMGTTSQPNNVTFSVKLSAGQEPVEISSATTAIAYTDPNKNLNNVYSSTTVTKVLGDSDALLEPGEKWTFVVKLNDAGIYGATVSLSTLQKFHIELRPTTGSVLTVDRRLPAALENIMVLS